MFGLSWLVLFEVWAMSLKSLKMTSHKEDAKEMEGAFSEQLPALGE